MRWLSILLLPACGGQSGENDKGGVPAGPCDEVSSEPLVTVPEADWPEGVADGVDLWVGLDGNWTATLRCADAEDEAAALAFEVGGPDTLTMRTYSGSGCEVTNRVVGETGFALASASFSGEQDLETVLEWGGVHLSGDGITLIVQADGSWRAAIDSARWEEEDSHSDASCELVNVIHTEGS